MSDDNENRCLGRGLVQRQVWYRPEDEPHPDDPVAVETEIRRCVLAKGHHEENCLIELPNGQYRAIPKEDHV